MAFSPLLAGTFCGPTNPARLWYFDGASTWTDVTGNLAQYMFAMNSTGTHYTFSGGTSFAGFNCAFTSVVNWNGYLWVGLTSLNPLTKEFMLVFRIPTGAVLTGNWELSLSMGRARNWNFRVNHIPSAFASPDPACLGQLVVWNNALYVTTSWNPINASEMWYLTAANAGGNGGTGDPLLDDPTYLDGGAIRADYWTPPLSDNGDTWTFGGTALHTGTHLILAGPACASQLFGVLVFSDSISSRLFTWDPVNLWQIITIPAGVGNVSACPWLFEALGSDAGFVDWAQYGHQPNVPQGVAAANTTSPVWVAANRKNSTSGFGFNGNSWLADLAGDDVAGMIQLAECLGSSEALSGTTVNVDGSTANARALTSASSDAGHAYFGCGFGPFYSGTHSTTAGDPGVFAIDASQALTRLSPTHQFGATNSFDGVMALTVAPVAVAAVTPPTRQYPRDDRLAVGSARQRGIGPGPSSMQNSIRQGFAGTYSRARSHRRRRSGLWVPS